MKGHSSKCAALTLRLGLAFVFLWAAISSFIAPNDWIGFLPSVLTEHLSAPVVLKIFTVYELALAAWLLSGVFVRYASLVVIGTLLGIVATNFSLFIVTFRDLGLCFAALALFFLDQD